MKNKEALQLLEKFKQGACSQEELELLDYWAHNLNAGGNSGLSEIDLAESSVAMWDNISGYKAAKVRRLQWLRVAAALVVFAMLGLLFRVYYNHDPAAAPQSERLANHITPGSNKAILTLSNGKRIVLDDAAGNGIIADGGIKITRSASGQLIYTVSNVAGKSSQATAYNTLSTPKGGQYQVNLPDGTKIWLNAASSIRFPVAFLKTRREVELTGEGYFEVKHLAKYKGTTVPFSVKTAGSNGQLVEVLGTHFNINAYADESVVKTTLLEGSVRLKPLNIAGTAAAPKILNPGQQSVLNNKGITIAEADLDEAVAWKNGYFRFNDENLGSIMRKVEKWYDVEIAYQDEGLRKKSFAGITRRYANVADLLKTLELTNEVKFKIDGNRITVLAIK